MSASALLSELRRRHIHVRAEGTELRCSAPAGALTADLREQLRHHKNDLIALLASAHALAAQPRAVVPLQPHGSRAPVFGVPGHNGDVFCYRVLAQSLGDERPFYGLQPPGLDGEREPLMRVEELAAYFVDQLLAFRPAGPCIIAGFCAGGTVAFELAQQLVRAGTRVPLLALFGSPYPSYFKRRQQIWRAFVRQVRALGRHGGELLAQPWNARRYVAQELRERSATRKLQRAAALDPVLMRRAKVERASLGAVRRYVPGRFAGRLALFQPGREWLESGVAAPGWRAAAAQVEEYHGPQASSGADMLRERHAAVFAALFRVACRECE